MLDWIFEGIVIWISSVMTSLMDAVSRLFLDVLGTDMMVVEEYFPFQRFMDRCLADAQRGYCALLCKQLGKDKLHGSSALGNNVDNSLDSRYWSDPFVPHKDVVARVFA